MHTVHIDCAGRELRLLWARGEQPMFRLDEDGPSLSDVVDSLWEETAPGANGTTRRIPHREWPTLGGVGLLELQR